MDNCNWMLDYGGYLELDPPNFSWPSSSPPTLSVELDDTYGNSDAFKESGSRKRSRSGSCNLSGSKACREKMRRDQLNDRFLELSSILDPGRPSKMDKMGILSDAVRVVSQLREDAQKLRESTENLQGKINELKAEKNELRDEKQQLRAEKDIIEQKLKAISSQPSFLPHHSTLPTAFPAPRHVVGSKLMPIIGYPGVSMWQFLPSAAVDTSQDHVLRPPVA
ncbi:transcription factor ILR3-like [Lotus japonicus]|uniref:transcription factor ILR3-like n=1 Tax=Lotus japonicus TaxID=34305 RepID=UPI0025878C69|nr:transcription factor ILR3-like [Lotus japonicus]